MKMASIYQRKDDWFYQPSSQATTGLWIATTPVVRLNQQATPEDKWRTAAEMLDASQEGVPVPNDPNTLVIPLLRMAQVSTWAAFMKNAKCVVLELENNSLRVIPQRQLPRPKGAMEEMTEKAIVLPLDALPELLGAALQRGLALSE
jgi:hypothetical protein